MYKAWTQIARDLRQTDVAKWTDDLVESVGDGSAIILDPSFDEAYLGRVNEVQWMM